eukprot:TRINITY_DN5343_c0_g1_i5.p1 TRINITY_DN5343_c0_g1~~TRINITY_DN5343_c0_g1_i5.p1  ORF type:complete len:235 (-),score=29.19 TRINITY_DN5343_c0_g1_i5:58-762(-)
MTKKPEVLEESLAATKEELPSNGDAKSKAGSEKIEGVKSKAAASERLEGAKSKAAVSEKLEGVKSKATVSEKLEGSGTSGQAAVDATSKPPVAAAAWYTWHVLVIIISIAMAWSSFGKEGWDLKSLWGNWTAFHTAWSCQFVVSALPVVLTEYAHGPIQSWCADVWFGLLARSALINIPTSWALAYLYCHPFLFMNTCNLGRYDSVMALGTLFWAVILTQLSSLFSGLVTSGSM